MRAETLCCAPSSVAGTERVFGKLLFTVCGTAGHTPPEQGHQIHLTDAALRSTPKPTL